MRSIWILLGLGLLAGTPTAIAGTPSSPTVLLEADFDNKPAGLPIGTGDAELNEPFDLSGLSATVIEDSASQNHLRVINESGTTGARRVKFGSGPDSREVEYRSLQDMIDTLALIVNEVQPNAPQPIRTSYIAHSRE